jgi:hypothetical protein
MRVPRVNPLPSDPTLVPGAPSIVQTLEPYHKGATQVYWCPADTIINFGPDPQAAATVQPATYYEREGTSYEYNVFFNAFAFDWARDVNKVWRDALYTAEQRGILPHQVIVMNDFDPFHDKKGTPTARNALYADFHVDKMELPNRLRP